MKLQVSFVIVTATFFVITYFLAGHPGRCRRTLILCTEEVEDEGGRWGEGGQRRRRRRKGSVG